MINDDSLKYLESRKTFQSYYYQKQKQNDMNNISNKNHIHFENNNECVDNYRFNAEYSNVYNTNDRSENIKTKYNKKADINNNFYVS